VRVEVDQSGRIEETNRDTVLGFANRDVSLTIKISAKTKRQLLARFRKLGKPKVFPVVIFAAAVFVGVKHLGPILTDLVIDKEYPGHEGTIVNIIREGIARKIDISFQSIGKKSKAHYLAYGVFMGRGKASIELTTEGLKEYIK